MRELTLQVDGIAALCHKNHPLSLRTGQSGLRYGDRSFDVPSFTFQYFKKYRCSAHARYQRGLPILDGVKDACRRADEKSQNAYRVQKLIS